MRPDVGMNFIRNLKNPLALVVQGFLGGALLFTGLHPGLLSHDSAQADARATAAVESLIR